jgi:hypothetical protein
MERMIHIFEVLRALEYDRPHVLLMPNCIVNIIYPTLAFAVPANIGHMQSSAEPEFHHKYRGFGFKGDLNE